MTGVLLLRPVQGELALFHARAEFADEGDDGALAEGAHQVGEGRVEGCVCHHLRRDTAFGGLLPGIQDEIERFQTLVAAVGERQHDLPPFAPHRPAPRQHADPRESGSDPWPLRRALALNADTRGLTPRNPIYGALAPLLPSRLSINRAVMRSVAPGHQWRTSARDRRLWRRLGERVRDLGAFGEEPGDGCLRRLRAGAIGAAVGPVAIVEAARELGPAQGRGAFRVHQFAHLVAPFLAVVGAAQL